MRRRIQRSIREYKTGKRNVSSVGQGPIAAKLHRKWREHYSLRYMLAELKREEREERRGEKEGGKAGTQG